MTEIQFILPPRDSDFLSESLRLLTEKICEAHPELEGGYGLGGPHGYGENFENSAFVMRRFYWGDCDCGYEQREEEWCKSHKHSEECYQTELRNLKLASGMWKAAKSGWMEWLDSQAPYDKCRALEDGFYKQLSAKHGLDPKFGAAVHCTCDYEPQWKAFCDTPDGRHADTCSTALPNFRHKATGFEVRWYKWIGRDNELTNEPADVAGVITDCLRSLSAVGTLPTRNE